LASNLNSAGAKDFKFANEMIFGKLETKIASKKLKHGCHCAKCTICSTFLPLWKRLSLSLTVKNVFSLQILLPELIAS